MHLILTLNFLKKLAKNNSKEWFDKNRPLYEDVKAEVKILVKDVIASIATFDTTIASLEPKDCMFRINRDVRFSKNKSPYKTNMGFMIAPGGKKSLKSCYYVHIEPGNCFLAGGIHMPIPDQLKLIRQEIDYNGDALSAIFKDKKFKKYFLDFDADMKLVRIPKDYKEPHMYAEWLKLKSFTVTMPIDDTVFGDKKLVEFLNKSFKEVHVLNQFLNAALD